jgi:hypothetical protein
MAEIFGFDENDLFRRLKDVLHEVEKKQKERDKDGPPNPVTGLEPDPCIVIDNGEAEGGEASRLYIGARLEGRQRYTIDVMMRIKIS